ncbi:unnamed protein product [Zymoseptoria tritici ST99CH_3D1]|uniref:Protein kinase domain-containing protein n=1 Tax=Zymoseptoria tritici ST99CH_1E4 TaxID=1276532 RepID=A0A2H1FJ31_ZYMTR|nr:unnamed protein product [Zymoseptoria tritici ST99CH_1E4]SMR43444.1 unnamed protein product [Zymoseptoria tritici ST99CH_3D1]
MEVVGCVSAVVALLSKGNQLIELIVTLRDARSEIAERVTKIQSHWVQTKVQLDFAERAWTGLSEEHQETQLNVLELLHGKVKSANLRVHGLIRKSDRATGTRKEQTRIKRSKYLFVKPFLDSVIRDLTQWQELYNPTWFLIMKIVNPIIDTELQRKDLSVSAEVNTRYSYVGIMTQDIRRLASKLKVVDPATFAVLRCRGVVKSRHQGSDRITSFEIVFETPSNHKPRTLRQHLLIQQPHSLTDRIHLAKRLAVAVNYVHTLGFVHKNVRPDNVISFPDPSSSRLPTFYLIGFENMRSEDGYSHFYGSEDWSQNIYRHPQRQGIHPEERYNMRHDIYSLGVCLLEIGLWSSFVSYGEQEVVVGPGEALDLSKVELQRCLPDDIKWHLVGLAKDKLRSVLGDMYTEVVVSCLTCLDGDSDDYGELVDEEDADGVGVGVRFIQKVLLKLNEISV